MSHHHSIRNLLNIKDENIYFDKSFCTEETIKGVQCKVFHGTLTYQPEACYACGHVFDEQIIKHGFKTSLIKIPSVSGFNAYCHFPHYLTAVFSDYLTGKASDAFPDFVGLNHKFIL